MKCCASEEGEGLIKEHSQLARPKHRNIESFFASVVGSLDMLGRRESCLADAYLKQFCVALVYLVHCCPSSMI